MSSSSPQPESWISAFCALVGHEYFAEVSEDFIEDDFNLTGLQSQVTMYKEALEMILDVEPEDVTDEEDEEEEEEEDEDEDDEDMQDGDPGLRISHSAAARRHLRMASDLSVIESSAEMLYGLIHQRFITSRAGIQQMAEKYEMGHFGYCPRVFCHSAKVLPVGCSDIPGQETVKLFCPSCLDVYTPPNSRFQTVDGAFFGTTFGCLFFMTFPEMKVGGTKPFPAQEPSASNSPNAVASSSTNPQNGTGANGVSQSASNASRSLSSSLTSQPQLPPTSQQQQQQQQQSYSPSSTSVPPQPVSINGVSPRNLAPGLGPGNVYEPRIYGFRVSEFAKTGPRMKWLRSRPVDVGELDECRLWTEGMEAARRRHALQQQQQQQQKEHHSQDQVHIPGSNDAEMADQGGFDDEDDDDRAAAAAEEQDGTFESTTTGREGQHLHQDGFDHDDPGAQPEEDLPAPEDVAGSEVREVAARKKANTAASNSANATNAAPARRRTVGDGYPNGDGGGGGGTAVRVGEGG